MGIGEMSINLTSLFCKEIEYLLQYSENNYSKSCFNACSTEESYYLKYEESNHCGEALSVYNSEDVKWLRNEIEMCIKDDKKIVDIIESAMVKNRKFTGEISRELDLYNYMM